MIPCLVPNFVTKFFPQDLVDLTQRLDWHLGDNLPSPVLPRALGDLGNGGGAAPAEHDSQNTEQAVCVRDSKDAARPHFAVGREEWSRYVGYLTDV